MGKSWKDRPDKNYKQQKHRKKEKAWNTKNHISVREEKDWERIVNHLADDFQDW